jgi:3-phosphoshikimate 1-carboxyvinyltransferase
VQGPLRAPPQPLELEPDASAAAVGLAAACLSGGELVVPGLDRGSLQGDVRIVEHLARFGCDAAEEPGRLRAQGAPTRGASLDLSGEPDLAPVLAAVAADAAARLGAESRLEGLATLRGKESDRIAVLEEGLSRLGLAVQAGASSLRIAPGRGPLRAPLELDARGDHRMAFAFALLGLLVEGVRVRDAGCVAKSWPSFWEDLEALGARRLRA